MNAEFCLSDVKELFRVCACVRSDICGGLLLVEGVTCPRSVVTHNGACATIWLVCVQLSAERSEKAVESVQL